MHNADMRFLSLLTLFSVLLTEACAPSDEKKDIKCQQAVIGNEVGAGLLSTELLVPKFYSKGVENAFGGGILVRSGGCKKPLDAIISDETARHIIDASKDFKFTLNRGNYTKAHAKLGIWKFKRSNGEIEFFVINAFEIAPEIDQP